MIEACRTTSLRAIEIKRAVPVRRLQPNEEAMSDTYGSALNVFVAARPRA